MTEKAFAAALKDISTALYMISARLASGLLREYRIAKVNYFYDKAGENVEEWLVEIDRIIKANNVVTGRRMAVAVAYLRDVAAD